jgi:hypothetical protein
MSKHLFQWQNLSSTSAKKYNCGHCSTHVGPSHAYQANIPGTAIWGQIYICPNCSHPTYFSQETGQIPGIQYGNDVHGIKDENVDSLYKEARRCFAANAFTASTMIARKILMNLAVQHGANYSLKFIEYVDFLEKNNWVPPNGKKWVDKIRQKGNEANHEINLINKSDAEQILKFLEMLLKFNYEFILE